MLSVAILVALASIGAAQENPIDVVDDVKPYEGSIGPASPLYGLKIAFENLVERFTFNEKEKIERQIEHAERRLSEAKSALKNNETEAAEKALGRYREKIQVADDRISRISKIEPELLDAQKSIVKHELVLERLLESNPDNRGLETALDNSHKFEDKIESKTGVKLGKDEVQREPEHGVEGEKINAPTSIGEGENVTVQCGSGSAGTQVRYVGGNNLGIAGYDIKKSVTTGGKVDLVAAVTNATGAPAAAPLTWKLSTARGGRLSVNGCTATFTAASSTGTATVLVSIARKPTPTPTTGAGEGGPVMAGGGKIAYINIAGGGGGSAGDRQCGNEWLQVSISGPYSYSVNTFWLSGPGTGNQWSGPFTNSRTFQPIAPGNYVLRVTYAGGTQKTYNINVPACSYYKFVQSNQGWGR